MLSGVSDLSGSRRRSGTPMTAAVEHETITCVVDSGGSDRSSLNARIAHLGIASAESFQRAASSS